MSHTSDSQILRSVPWFLATAPTPGAEMVERPAVTALLDRSVAANRVTVLAAPSGFGKTVAASQWIAARIHLSPGSAAWLTLTDHVTDFGDILRGLITALQKAARDRGDAALFRALSAIYGAPTYQAAMDAAADLTCLQPVTVVIDDFHFARDILKTSDFLNFIEHCPPWIRLILLTTDPVGADVTRLRVHGKLAVAGASDLAMTADDVSAAAALLACPVNASEAEAIRKATGGWPAAVRLELLSGYQAPAFDAEADLTEYIRSAVLERMRPGLAEFVLTTTVTPRLDANLVASLWGQPDGATLIAECASSGLFIERFGNAEDIVYQWHSMFTAHCQLILRNRDPDRWRTLNAVAARELHRRHPLQAVDHAIRAEDPSLATEIITDHWLELLLQSRSEALDRACVEATTAFGEHPELVMIRACCRDLAGDTTGARHLLARARKLGSDETTSPQMDFISDITLVLLSADHEVMTAAADRAEAWLADRTVVGPSAYASTLFVLGWANSRLRRAERATCLLSAAVHECRVMGLTELAERARQALAFAAAQAGEFDRALGVVRSGKAQSDSAPEPWLSRDGDGIERISEGYVHFWRADLEAARDAFTEVANAAGSGYPDLARTMLCFTAAALGDRDSLDRAEAAAARMADADSHGVPWTSYGLASRARLAEVHGGTATALELAARLASKSHIPMMSAIASGISRRLNDPALARQLAEVATQLDSQLFSRVYGHLTIALLDWETGAVQSAHTELERSLTLGAAQRIRLPFADNPDPLCLDLLIAHRPRTAHAAFLDECLDACARAVRRSGVNATDPLTPRETEVLAYLRTPMTSDEIASRLSVSVNTLKTHQRAIYRKLGVTSRREALRVASRPIQVRDT